jgi:AcrR family transcriptional regulator
MQGSVRQRLVEAAFDLFEERGFEQTTVDDIAERAGVGRTTFFRNFRAKEQVIFPDHEGLLTAIRGRLATSSPETAVVGVTEAARLVLHHYVEEGHRARQRYALTRTVPALRDRERAGVQQYERLFATFIREWLDGGPRSALRAELLANAVVTAHNHVLRAWLRREVDDPHAAFDTAMSEVASLVELASRPPAAGPGTAVVVLRTDKDPEELRRRIQDLL